MALFKDKLKFLDALRSNIKKKKVVIDETKENFGFEKMKQLRDVDRDYIQGIPFRLQSFDGKKIVFKVTPVETRYEKNKNPVYIENIILKELTETFVKKYNIPNFLYYLGTLKISCKSPALRTKYFSILNNEGCIRSTCNVLISEYIDKGSLKEYADQRNLSLNVWKSIIFQVVFSIHAMQEKYKLMHNDLHHGNILIDKIDENGYLSYNIQNTKYYVKHNGIIPKLFDYEFAMSFKNNIKGMYENVLINDKKEYMNYYNEGSDLHCFFDSLLDFELPQELEDWIRSKYDPRILIEHYESEKLSSSSYKTDSGDEEGGNNESEKSTSCEKTIENLLNVTDFSENSYSSSSSSKSISKGDFTSHRRLLKGVEKIIDLPTPLSILTDPFFSSYMEKPKKYDTYKEHNIDILF